MEPRKQQLNLLTFLQNGNVVAIRDEDEFQWFLHIMRRHGLIEFVPCDTLKTQTYKAMVAEYEKEVRMSAGVRWEYWDGKTLYAECQLGKESIGIYPYDEMAVTSWYGGKPMSVSDINDPGPGSLGAPYHHHDKEENP